MNASRQLQALKRNAIEIISEESLLAKLEKSLRTATPLIVKAGFDPSSPDIHLGHTVLLTKLRQFQDFGHKVVFIIGDYTAMIGDPSGRSQTRPILSRAEVDKNAQTYQEQAFKILSRDPSKIQIVRNSGWFNDQKMFRVFLENIGTNFTVARLLERDDFEKRMENNQPITIREFMYPLLQGYDSVEIGADIEIGGTDQKFNLLVGRDMQRACLPNHDPQAVMTLPLLVGLDGVQKMSKSLGNYVGVTDAPKEMFGKIMSIPDTLMPAYYDLLTDRSGKEIEAAIKAGSLHPKKAKEDLAVEIVKRFCSENEAAKAREEFDRIFSRNENPSDMPVFKIDTGEHPLIKLMQQAGLSASASAARREIEQKAVSLDGKVISDPRAVITVVPNKEFILKVGKRRFARFGA